MFQAPPSKIFHDKKNQVSPLPPIYLQWEFEIQTHTPRSSRRMKVFPRSAVSEKRGDFYARGGGGGGDFPGFAKFNPNPPGWGEGGYWGLFSLGEKIIEPDTEIKTPPPRLERCRLSRKKRKKKGNGLVLPGQALGENLPLSLRLGW